MYAKGHPAGCFLLCIFLNNEGKGGRPYEDKSRTEYLFVTISARIILEDKEKRNGRKRKNCIEEWNGI